MNNDDVNREIQRKARERQNAYTQRRWDERDAQDAKTRTENEAHSRRMRDLHGSSRHSDFPTSGGGKSRLPGGSGGTGVVGAVVGVVVLLAVFGSGHSSKTAGDAAYPTQPERHVPTPSEQPPAIEEPRAQPAPAPQWRPPAETAVPATIVIDAFSVPRAVVAPGETLEIATRWHLSDGSQQKVVFSYRLDSLSDPAFAPIVWNYSTIPGAETVPLRLPANLPPGRYTIANGWTMPGQDGDERAIAIVVTGAEVQQQARPPVNMTEPDLAKQARGQ